MQAIPPVHMDSSVILHLPDFCQACAAESPDEEHVVSAGGAGRAGRIFSTHGDQVLVVFSFEEFRWQGTQIVHTMAGRNACIDMLNRAVPVAAVGGYYEGPNPIFGESTGRTFGAYWCMGALQRCQP